MNEMMGLYQYIFFRTLGLCTVQDEIINYTIKLSMIKNFLEKSDSFIFFLPQLLQFSYVIQLFLDLPHTLVNQLQ